MNPLTQVKRIQKINSREAALGISEQGSWHTKYKDSAYVFAGGIPFDLTEGDLLAVFSQYGEVVDVNLVRDKGTGKSKGFAFLAYEDQRSTILAVDNLNGAKLLGRTIRVDHVSNYKKKEEEDDEKEQQKRETRGVCRAFQRGECNRGASCKFSHDEQRSSNTGWGPKDHGSSKWGHENYEGPSKSQKTLGHLTDQVFERTVKEGESRSRHSYKAGQSSISETIDSQQDRKESSLRNHDRQGSYSRSEKHKHESRLKERYSSTIEKRSGKHKYSPNQEKDMDIQVGRKQSRHDRKSPSL